MEHRGCLGGRGSLGILVMTVATRWQFSDCRKGYLGFSVARVMRQTDVR